MQSHRAPSLIEKTGLGADVSVRMRVVPVLLLVWGMGCLSPQSIDVEEVVVVNQPPSFDPTADVSPRGAVVCLSDLDATPKEFRLGNLRDADGGRLEARWFINYEGGFLAIQKAQTLERASGEPVYPPTTFLSSEIDPVHRNTLAPFAIEVVVSDGFAAYDQIPKNRAVADGAYAVSYRWVVQNRQGTPCE